MEVSDVMAIEGWEEIDGFATPGEFERCRCWIAEAVDEAAIVEVPIRDPYGGSPMFEEHWYQRQDGSVWRLVGPELPFRGLLERVRRP